MAKEEENDEEEIEEKYHKTNKSNNSKWLILGIVALIVIVAGYIFLNQQPKEYCGDNVCNGNENKCSCASDCGNCYNLDGCNQYSCDSNNECTISSTINNCCGNGKCEEKETCSSCASDCGSCKSISSASEAVNQVLLRQDIKEQWESTARVNNCGVKYLESIGNAVYFVARITVSQNLIECNKWNNYYYMRRALNTTLSQQFLNNMDSCDKSLVETYNKALRGFESSDGVFAINDNCFDCNDFYAINFGCVDADIDISTLDSSSGTGSYGVGIVQSPKIANGAVIVDAKTGSVYW
jgi:hypothetical protein